MPAGPAVDDVIAWLGFRAWGAAIAFASRQRESEATWVLQIRDAEIRGLRRGCERQREETCTLVQPFAALDIMFRAVQM